MRQQFLKLLAEHPGDINIGLIYADWLAEQGDSEEAYWRDPRIYTQAWTAIFDNHGDRTGDGYGDGNGFGDADGDGRGCSDGTDDGDGEDRLFGYNKDQSGNGYGWGFGDSSGNGPPRDGGRGYGLNFVLESNAVDFGEWVFGCETHLGRLLRCEVLMEGRYILICDRGFVLVGDVSPHSSDWQRVIVDHCSTVRLWGTTRGLGQLALEGPQPETILDYEGSGVDVLRATILRAIPCNETAWEQYPELITKEGD